MTLERGDVRRTIAQLYQQGHRVSEIAAVVGLHRANVYNHLSAAGVERRDDRLSLPGKPRSTHCAQGHEWTEENTRVDKRGSRHCRMCEVLYEYIGRRR